MKFTIGVSDGLGTTHRLKKDGSFKEFAGNNETEILEDDYVFDDYYKAVAWKKSKRTIEVEGKEIEVSPVIYQLTDPSVSVRFHRTSKPKQKHITREELKKVLLEGNDSRHNSLVIDFDGYLHLVPFEEAKDGPFAVRYETFIAGNGYVGSESSIYHIDGVFLALLEGWLSHLETHEREYVDISRGQTEEELIKDINNVIESL